MKILISVDIEGVAGVTESLQGQRGNPEYETARRLMTQEANAAIRGAFAGGASAVTVVDSHGPLRNMLADELHPDARVISGRPRPLSMIQGIGEEHDGLVLIGWHAAADNYGILAHTVNGACFRRIEINGVHTGEPTIFAGLAAQRGVPLLAVSGDDRLADEMREQFPRARRIVVKTAIAASSSDSLSPQAARALIESEVEAAVKAAAKSKPKAKAPYKLPIKLDLYLRKQIFADGAAMIPGARRTGPESVAFTCKTSDEAIGVITVVSMIATSLGT